MIVPVKETNRGKSRLATARADDRALAVARSAAPAGAEIGLTRSAGSVQVEVRARLQVPFPGGATFQVASRSVADLEHLPGGSR